VVHLIDFRFDQQRSALPIHDDFADTLFEDRVILLDATAASPGR